MVLNRMEVLRKQNKAKQNPSKSEALFLPATPTGEKVMYRYKYCMCFQSWWPKFSEHSSFPLPSVVMWVLSTWNSQATSSGESSLAQTALQKAPLPKKQWKNKYIDAFQKYSAAERTVWTCTRQSWHLCGHQPQDHGSAEWRLPRHDISELRES